MVETIRVEAGWPELTPEQRALWNSIDCWSCNDDDLVSDVREAVENELENREPDDADVSVYGYVRAKLPENAVFDQIELALEGIYEALDDAYGNPDASQGEDVPDEVQIAASRLEEAIRKSYVVWNCTRVLEVVLTRAEAERVASGK